MDHSIVLKSYGKINLGLDVLRRREDGYHEVRMIMQTVGLYDVLTMKKRNCAAALKGMNQLFDLGLSIDELCEIGVTLGADVPYCIWGGTALSEGIGEKLSRVDAMPDCYILIAKPGISVSTAFVYKNLDLPALSKHPDIDGMLECLKEKDLTGICNRL